MTVTAANIIELNPIRMPGTKNNFLFRWSDSYVGKYYQLYINSILVAETTVPDAIKQLSAVVSGTYTWEILAIDQGDLRQTHTSYLTYGDTDGGKIQFKWLRDPTLLEIGSWVDLYTDLVGVPGTKMNLKPVLSFPSGAGSWGFGMGSFGDSFGYDGTGVGFGFGSFGNGAFGFDAEYVEWKSKWFPPGDYDFHLLVYDSKGNPDSANGKFLNVLVNSIPKPPAAFSIQSYTPTTDILIFSVTEGDKTLPY